MGTISAPATIYSALDNNVVDDAAIEIQALGLSVCPQVDEQLADGLDGLLGPPTEGGELEVLDLCVAANTTCEASVRDDLFLLGAVLEVLYSSVKFLSLNALGNIVGVLEMNTEVRNLALGG